MFEFQYVNESHLVIWNWSLNSIENWCCSCGVIEGKVPRFDEHGQRAGEGKIPRQGFDQETRTGDPYALGWAARSTRPSPTGSACSQSAHVCHERLGLGSFNNSRSRGQFLLHPFIIFQMLWICFKCCCCFYVNLIRKISFRKMWVVTYWPPRIWSSSITFSSRRSLPWATTSNGWTARHSRSFTAPIRWLSSAKDPPWKKKSTIWTKTTTSKSLDLESKI